MNGQPLTVLGERIADPRPELRDLNLLNLHHRLRKRGRRLRDRFFLEMELNLLLFLRRMLLIILTQPWITLSASEILWTTSFSSSSMAPGFWWLSSQHIWFPIYINLSILRSIKSIKFVLRTVNAIKSHPSRISTFSIRRTFRCCSEDWSEGFVCSWPV